MKFYHSGVLLSTLELLRPVAAVSTVTVSINTAICTTTTGLPSPSVPSSSPVVIYYTTTNSLGSMIITSSTSYITQPTGSSSVIVYTSTNSAGSTVVTSSTSFGPAPTGSSSVIVYTTTNSAGSAVVTSSTSYGPAPTGSSSVIVYTTTNPAGSTIVTSTTSYAPVPIGPGAPCPANLAQLYQVPPNGNYYEIFCTANFEYNDLPAKNSTTFEQCMAACDAYVPSAPNTSGDLPCVAVTWDELNANGTCYPKSAITSVVYGIPTENSAKLISYNPPIGNISISLSMSSSSLSTALSTGSNLPGTSTSSISTTGGTSFTAPNGASSPTGGTLSSPAGGISSSSTAGTATSGSSSSTTTSPSATVSTTITSSSATVSTTTSSSSATVNPSATGSSGGSSSGGPPNSPPCPAANGTIYNSTPGRSYTTYCGIGIQGNDLPAANVSTFEACMSACDQFVPNKPPASDDEPCIGVTWAPTEGNGDQCFLKYSSANQATNPEQDCAILVNATNANPFNSSDTNTYEPVNPCPYRNGSVYKASASSNLYRVDCGIEYLYDDLTSLTALSYDGCISACDSYQPSASVGSGATCIGISYDGKPSYGANCFLKYALSGSAFYDPNLADSAVMYTYINNGTLTSAPRADEQCGVAFGGATCAPSAGTCCSIHGFCGSDSDYCAASNCQSGACTAPAGTGTGSSGMGTGSGSGTSGGTTSGGTGTCSAASTTFTDCPNDSGSSSGNPNGTYYSPASTPGQVYQILCNYLVRYDNLPVYNTTSFEACIDECVATPGTVAANGVSGTEGCAAVSYAAGTPTPNNCQLHYSINAGINNGNGPDPGFDSAILINCTTGGYATWD